MIPTRRLLTSRDRSDYFFHDVFDSGFSRYALVIWKTGDCRARDQTDTVCAACSTRLIVRRFAYVQAPSNFVSFSLSLSRRHCLDIVPSSLYRPSRKPVSRARAVCKPPPLRGRATSRGNESSLSSCTLRAYITYVLTHTHTHLCTRAAYSSKLSVHGRVCNRIIWLRRKTRENKTKRPGVVIYVQYIYTTGERWRRPCFVLPYNTKSIVCDDIDEQSYTRKR